MRARGAKVTDIAAIVVAADDGVMPQTVEAIDHAKAAGVPIVIVDQQDRQARRQHRASIKQQLTEFELVPEEWGGDTVFVEASAKKRLGLDNFLDMLLLVAEVGELRANPNAPGERVIIEAKLDPGRGPVATLLVSRGTLRSATPSSPAGQRPRARHARLHGQPLKAGGPSTPVEIVGFDELPTAGEFCRVRQERARGAHPWPASAPTGIKAEELGTRSARSPSTTSSRASRRARSATST